MRLLFCGDSPTVDTGFGVVAKNLLLRLHKKGYKIGTLGINMYGEPYDQRVFPFPIWPVDRGSIDLMYGYYKFWHLAKTFNPDIIFFLNDPWVIHKYMSMKPEDDNAYRKIIAYYPTDGGPMKKEWVDMLNGFDAQIGYSNFAERVVTESNGGVRPKNLHQMYHGIDTKIFFPIQQHEARARLGLDPSWFIVGMVARNQYRKRFDLLMKAFAEFAKNKPEVKLYLHTAFQDVGFDIQNMADQFDLGDKLIASEGVTPSTGVPEEQLNLIYNSFDVHALISLGDGFGLPVAESMATGCPQLVSGHSCLQELVEGHGGLTVKTSLWMMNTSGFNTWGGVSDWKDIQNKLQVLYDNQELRLKLAQQGYEYIHQDQFNWDHIVNKLDKIIKDSFHIIGGNNGRDTELQLANARRSSY